MANNRLYLRCKQCGKVIVLGKHFGGSLTVSQDLENRLQDFFIEHCYCNLDGVIYSLELCEEFPCEMTDNPIDETGKDWREIEI